MKKQLIMSAPAIIRSRAGSFAGRRRTCDVAFTYRMGAGFSGDVNRTHPFDIEPCLIDVANPPAFYGQAVVIGANNAVRAILDTDDALTSIYGVAVRPFPTQQQSGGMSSPFGVQVPPVSGVIDILRLGYVMVQMHGTPNKGDPLYVWSDPTAGGEVLGQFTTTTTGGSTIGPLTGSSSFNGPPDSGTPSIGEIYLSQ